MLGRQGAQQHRGYVGAADRPKQSSLAACKHRAGVCASREQQAHKLGLAGSGGLRQRGCVSAGSLTLCITLARSHKIA